MLGFFEQIAKLIVGHSRCMKCISHGSKHFVKRRTGRGRANYPFHVRLHVDTGGLRLLGQSLRLPFGKIQRYCHFAEPC